MRQQSINVPARAETQLAERVHPTLTAKNFLLGLHNTFTQRQSLVPCVPGAIYWGNIGHAECHDREGIRALPGQVPILRTRPF
ncbi:MAG: hypothetical protein ACLR2O_05790 [Coprococcus sp.]